MTTVDNAQDEGGRGVEFGTLAEQLNEDYYDDRSGADDDLEKGRINFPNDRLYGRDKELATLHDIFGLIMREDDGTSRAVFLGGYSGTGKSALVKEFVHQHRNNSSTNTTGVTAAFVSGKFSPIKSGDPLSTITHALNDHVIQLPKTLEDEDLNALNKRLAKVDIAPGSYDAAVLKGTIIPGLDELLTKTFKSDGRCGDASGNNDDEINSSECNNNNISIMTARGVDFNVIKYVFQNFIKALASENMPIILFLDDLQWSDDASLQILTGLLKDKSISHLLFIGGYRINEVNEEHAFTKMMKDVEKARKDWNFTGHHALTTRMKITNLSPDSVAEFIADSMNRSVEEVSPVASAVYSKTLGNIFFVKQALEELVRKNAIYYDVIYFQWQFGDVSRVELEQCLSDDVIDMVQAKLKTLPDLLQKALAVAAYTDNTIELDLLEELLRSESSDIDPEELRKLMKIAFLEGLVLQAGKNYKFAHDRIREAAYASVPEGDERNNLLIRISGVLEEKGAAPGPNDWMLFAAARLLSSVPADVMTSQLRITKLNFCLGKISISKGAFNEAVAFLRAAHDRLDPRTCWQVCYELTLDLETNLAETEHFLGNEEKAIELSESIFRNAHSLLEKCRAHFVYIEAMSKTSINYDRSIEKAIEILKLYDVKIPRNPTERQVKWEKLRLKLALGGRNLQYLSKLPVATDELMTARSKIAVMTLIYANYGKRPGLATMVGHRVLRESLWSKSITKDVPFILVMLGSPLRQQEKYEDAFAFANAGISLMERFPNEKGLEFVKAKMALYGVLSCLRLPFRKAIDTYLELYKLLLAKGEVEMALGAGMLAMMSFVNASLPLDALFEPKLMLFEEVAVKLGRKTFVVIFGLIRQALYNLQGGSKASTSPATVNGGAFCEVECNASFEGAARKMNNRDISIIRLMLAVIFDDEIVMGQMLDRLENDPVYDMSLVRQHLRMSYTGLASHILCKTDGKYQKWAKISFDFFKKLSRFGSPNAIPMYACLKALGNPSWSSFDEAIQVCSNAGQFNVAAIMNERAGKWALEQNPKGIKHEEYLKCALWLYHDWGALAKVAQLKEQYDFLGAVMHEKSPFQLNEMRRQAAMLGVPHSTQPSEVSSSCVHG